MRIYKNLAISKIVSTICCTFFLFIQTLFAAHIIASGMFFVGLEALSLNPHIS